MVNEARFKRALKRQVLEFIKNADSQKEIGIPRVVVVRHISQTRHHTYSDYPYDDSDVNAEIMNLESEGKVLCYRAEVKSSEPEKTIRRFPDLLNHVLLLKYVGE